MKSLATIALIGLIGLTCFVPMHVNSHVYTDDGDTAHPGEVVEESGYGETLQFVYGSVSVKTSYEFPTAVSLHSVSIWNDSGADGLDLEPPQPQNPVNIRYYVDFTSQIDGPVVRGFDTYKDWSDDGWLSSYYGEDNQNGYWWKDNYHLDFDLSNQPKKEDYTLTADTSLRAKYDLNGDGIREEQPWSVSGTLTFEHKEEALGVED